jgi:hypothetical protein
MSTTEHDPFDEFLSHSGRDGGGGGKFLGNWKKREPPQVDTWMHTALSPKPVWQHGFYRVETRENKDTREMERVVWSMKFNCHESEEVLKKQFKIDDDGHRVAPPCRCPMCRMADIVRVAVLDGQIDPLEPIFRFEGSDPADAVVIHAAGIYGGFPRDREDFADEGPLTFKRFRDAKLSLKDVWKENMMAKLSYVFAVVDNKEPSRGVQIAVETALLGEKVRGVIADRRDRLGVEEGSFARNPCAIRWYHRPAEKEFNKKYHAIDLALSKVELTDEIEKLIRSDARAVIDRVNDQCVPGDAAMLRALMERYSLVELPWDRIFEGHDMSKPRDSKDKPPKASSRRRDENYEDAAPRAAVSSAKPDSTPFDDEDDDLPFECEECGEPVSATATECPKCGAPLDAEDAAPAAPPPQTKKADPPKVAAKPSVESASAAGKRKLAF